jgi:anti-sigma28 factor (negative regulator of flagellin synthesis)
MIYSFEYTVFYTVGAFNDFKEGTEKQRAGNPEIAEERTRAKLSKRVIKKFPNAKVNEIKLKIK